MAHRTILSRFALMLTALMALANAVSSFAQVQQFYLIDGASGVVAGTPIKTLDNLENKDGVDLVSLGSARLNLGADVTAPGGGDEAEVIKVEFYRDGVLVREDFEGPYTLFGENEPTMLQVGDYDITAIGYGTRTPNGAIETSEDDILLAVTDTGNPDQQAPEATIVSPVDGLTYYDRFPFVLVLADDDQAVGRVEISIDDSPIASAVLYPSATSPFEWQMKSAPGVPLTDGVHTVRARVYDVAGNTAGTASVTFTKQESREAKEFVTVQFDQTLAGWGKSRIGFNHGIEAGQTPPSEFVEEKLDLGTTREGEQLWVIPGTYARLINLGADVFALTYPRANLAWWENNVPPGAVEKSRLRPYDTDNDGNNEFTTYIDHLNDLVATAIDKGFVFERTFFEIWNEPALNGWGDLGTNFHGTRGEFFATMDVWHDTLKNRPNGEPDISLAASGHGSDAAFNPQEIEAMMKHLRDGGRGIEALSLHHLRLQHRFQLARDILGFYRDRYIDNAAANGFDTVGLERIVVNEFISEALHFYPAEVLFYPFLFEGVGIEGGAFTCGGGGAEACFNGDLLGMLVDDGSVVLHPRPIWWVFKEYSERYNTGLSSSSTFGKLISIASMDVGAQKAQILVALYAGEDSNKTQTIDVRLRQITELFSEEPTISITKIPFDLDGDKGEDPLPLGPVPVLGWGISPALPNAVITDLVVREHEVYIIDIE